MGHVGPVRMICSSLIRVAQMVINAIIEPPMVISPIMGELMVTRGTMEGG